MRYFLDFNWLNDAAESLAVKFQDPSTSAMEGIYSFNLHLLSVIIIIVLVFGWLLVSIIINFTEWSSSTVSDFTHSGDIEGVWTTLPALSLLALSSPSFSLLYSFWFTRVQANKTSVELEGALQLQKNSLSMFLSLNTITKHLPVFKLELFNEESVVVSHSFWIEEIVNALSMHFKCQFKVLSCISDLDYSGSFYRFRVVYDFLSIKFNSRIRVKVATNELTPVNSIEKTFPEQAVFKQQARKAQNIIL